FDVKERVFDVLRDNDMYYRKQKYPHRYPHCWRCGTELIYRLVDEWFISMGELYDKPREELTAAEKAASFRYQIMDSVSQANWIPSFGHDREMDWLRNMHDWMISKKRFWGLALPIWVCDECGCHDVIGSLEELKERAFEGWDVFEGHTPHRPYIDAVKLVCDKCSAKMTRIKDVGNPWLDAGIVAISTLRFSSDKDYFEKWYPADFISESFPGQFRNWFYSLLAQSTLMSQMAKGEIVGPFKNLFSYATLLAEDGREMHKSWGNAIWFDDGVEKMGADTMRWLYAGAIPDKNVRFGYGIGDEVRRKFLIPLWNVYSFLVTYANLDGWRPDVTNKATSDNAGNAQLDQWIIERMKETALEMSKRLEAYDALKATTSAESFLDDLSNWYVRRSRRRFWRGEMDTDKQAAYETLYFVLLQFSKLIAPIVPFISETIYQNLAFGTEGDETFGEALSESMLPKSVHHCLYPKYAADTLDRALLDKMGLAITAASLGRAARGSADIKLRQPLATARINVGSQAAQASLNELAEVLMEEINVKKIEVVSDVGDLVNYKLLPNNRLLGPKYGKRFGALRGALNKLDPAVAAQALQTDGALTVLLAGEGIVLSAEEILVQTEAKGDAAVASDKGVTVAVDTHLTPELLQEGVARDLVRNLNNARKDAGFAISDRINVTYQASPELTAAFTTFADYIQRETLADSLTVGDGGDFTTTVKIGGEEVTLSVSKVA
ncbi:MAG TPA: isoleucine--tRNA ligase, partial [Anaerolineae bacterium]|nr:isoleucine--tRNA ligase [Anaerolineae bacterium]